MITEQEISLPDMKRIIQQQQKCAECGALLTLAWGGAFGHECYVLRCGRDSNHQGIERPYVPSAYALPDEVTRYNLSRGRKEKLMGEHGEEKTRKLQRYAGAGSLTREEAGEILRTIWPDAPMREVLKASIICQQYGLNPLMKHLFLICFNKGKPAETWATVMGIQATRLKAHERESFSYVDNTPRIMTPQEQEIIFGEVDKENIWAITKVRDAKGNVAPGYGNWPKASDVYGREKGNSRFNMAAIRSERQALDRLFGGMLPMGVETVDERYVESPYQVVDQETGEITPPEAPAEGEQEIPPTQAGEAPLTATVERPGLAEKVTAGAKQAQTLFDQQFGPATSAEPADSRGQPQKVYLASKAQGEIMMKLGEDLKRRGIPLVPRAPADLSILTVDQAADFIKAWDKLSKGKQ